MARYRDREELKDELNERLAECQVVGYEIWQPRTDDVKRRLRAVVEAFDKLQYWRDECRQRKAPTEQAKPILDEFVDGLRTAFSKIEPLARKWDLRNPHGVDAGNDEFRWLTTAEAERIFGTNRGMISRAVNKGELKSNGKSGRERRIDTVDLVRWQHERANKPERRESEAVIRRKLES
jgi:hypothetical protein